MHTIRNGKEPSPLVIRLTLGLLCAALLITLVVLAQDVVIPVLFAILLGILLRPVENFLNKKLRFPRVLAILVTMFFFLLFVAVIIVLTTYEITQFMEDLPALKKNLNGYFQNFRLWVAENLNITYLKQQTYIANATKEGLNPVGIMQKTLDSLTGLFMAAIVVPVLLFLVMYYRVLFLNFLLSAFGEKNRATMTAIIRDAKVALQGYIAGLGLEMITVALLQTGVMYFIGVKYALMIGLLTAVLNLIPYLGIMIAGSCALLISAATSTDPRQMIYIILGFAAVQFIDNNILLPKLVGSRIRINAFFSIVGVITGGIICGVPGMFLSIPLMALIRVVLANIDHLKPWAELMSDHPAKKVRWKNLFRKTEVREKKEQ